MPAAETETVPNWLVRVIPSAQAAIGNANASNTRTTTRLILLPSQIFLPFFHLGTSCPRYRSPLLLEHLRFQNYKTLVLLFYQQLNNIYRDCSESRIAIFCILATIRFPRSLNPAGGVAYYGTEQPMGSESAGEISATRKKTYPCGIRF